MWYQKWTEATERKEKGKSLRGKAWNCNLLQLKEESRIHWKSEGPLGQETCQFVAFPDVCGHTQNMITA